MAKKSKFIANLVEKPKDNESVIQKLYRLPKEARLEILDKIVESKYPELGYKAIRYDWELNGRPDQLIPLNFDNEWSTFVFNMGRGSGKTRSSAEWVRHIAQEYPGCRIAMVGSTASDVHKTMLGGDSGLLTITPEWEGIHHIPTYQRLEWKNGSIAEYFSSEKPDRLRGPQFHFAWLDELTSWKNPESTFDMLSFGLRLGNDNRTLVSTTPKNVDFYKKLLGIETTWTLNGSTFDNMANLSPKFIQDMVSRYEGTRLGKQELEADILEDVEGALWSQKLIDETRILPRDSHKISDFAYVVIAVDPAMTTNKRSDETGICVAAYGIDDHYYVLYADSHKDTASEWANRVLALYDEFMCGSIVVEKNQGGDMVLENLQKARPNIAVHGVHTKKGKYLRAEPIQHLYELKKVHHVGSFPKAEDQMTQFNPVKNPDGDDDICLIGSTLVKTNNGDVPISEIKNGDMVLTRDGMKKVTASGQTSSCTDINTVILCDGTLLMGTPNHKVFDANGTEIRIKNLKKGDKLFKWNQWQGSTVSFKVLNTLDTRMQKTGEIEIILQKEDDTYIERFGSTIMEQFQKAIISITKTKTPLTTTFQILNAYRRLSTNIGIQEDAPSWEVEKRTLHTWLKLEKLLQNGISQMREESGTDRRLRLRILERLSILNQFVCYVEMMYGQTNEQNSVQRCVKLDTIEKTVNTILKSNAKFAEAFSLFIDMVSDLEEELVPESVFANYKDGKKAVYNLTVEDKHEYVANGYLIRNCDALTYALSALAERAMVDEVYAPAVGGIRSKLTNFKLR